MSRIGVYDSGVGGLTVLRECLSLSHSFYYLGDSARTPYGTKSKDTIMRYALECGMFLKKKEIDFLVVACNTVSSFCLGELQEKLEIPVIGTIEPALNVLRTHPDIKRVGVIGTEATIRGGAYERGLCEVRDSLKIKTRACSLFVPLVEHGFVTGEIPYRVVEHYLSDFRGEVDAIILGCTHYPLLKEVIQEYVGKEVLLIDCAIEIGKVLSETENLLRTQDDTIHFFVTDDSERFSLHVEKFLDKNKALRFHVEQVVL